MSPIVFASFFFIYLTKGKLEKTKVTLIFNAQLRETTKQYATLYRCIVLFYKPERNWLLSERTTSSFQFKRRTCYTLAVFSTTEGWSCLGESVILQAVQAGCLAGSVTSFWHISSLREFVSACSTFHKHREPKPKKWTLPGSYVSPCPLP